MTAGVYNVQLTVFDNNGKADAIAQTITVGSANIVNQLPTASFVQTVNNLVVNVDGSGSKDTDGSIASYLWIWGDSSSNSAGVTASHTYSTAGTFTITLKVTDNSGASSSSSQTITVTQPPPLNNPPVSAFEYSTNGRTINFTFNGYDNDGTISSYQWKFGDGQTSNVK